MNSNLQIHYKTIQYASIWIYFRIPDFFSVSEEKVKLFLNNIVKKEVDIKEDVKYDIIKNNYALLVSQGLNMLLL